MEVVDLSLFYRLPVSLLHPAFLKNLPDQVLLPQHLLLQLQVRQALEVKLILGQHLQLLLLYDLQLSLLGEIFFPQEQTGWADGVEGRVLSFGATEGGVSPIFPNADLTAFLRVPPPRFLALRLEFPPALDVGEGSEIGLAIS